MPLALSLASMMSAPTPLHARFLSQDCPDVSPIENLDIAEYTRASWYVQKQQVTSYQNEDQLQCVVATYDAGESRWWQLPFFFDGEVLSVYNSFEGGQSTIDGEGHPTNRLCASVTDSSDPSRLLVAPCFLPVALGGKYWVIGVGVSSSGQYEWAVVSGGPPTEKYSDGCTTGTGYFNSGLWIFSRTPVLSDEKLAEATTLLTDKGYTLQLLQDVRQENCTYANTYIKP